MPHLKEFTLRRVLEIILGPIVLRRTLPKAMGSGKIFVSGKAGGLRYFLSLIIIGTQSL